MAAAVVLAIGIGSKAGLTERGRSSEGHTHSVTNPRESRALEEARATEYPRSARPGSPGKPTSGPTNDTGPQNHRRSCIHARAGRAWYLLWTEKWLQKMGLRFQRGHEHARTCDRARELAQIAKRKAVRARHRYEEWREEYFLPEADSWHEAIRIAQRAYPGTSGWLYSCSADEGGWGRWVGYRGRAYSSSYEDSDGVGGWLQFRPSTYRGFVRHAISDVRRRGFKVPSSAESWLSPLGQALAGAWGITHGQAHHWAGAGC